MWTKGHCMKLTNEQILQFCADNSISLTSDWHQLHSSVKEKVMELAKADGYRFRGIVTCSKGYHTFNHYQNKLKVCAK